MTVPEGVIIQWPSTAASIPSGWSRVAGLDGRFLKGVADGVNPDITGGSDNHSHGSSGHTHTVQAHTHVGTNTGGPAGFPSAPSGNIGLGASVNVVNYESHTHPLSSSTSSSSSSTLQSESSVWSSASRTPSHYTMIMIQSDGTPTGFPDGSVVFFNNTTLPDDWIQHNGSKGRYIRGAASGSGGGSTGGSSTSHSHSNNHSHQIGPHTHGTGETGDTVRGSFNGFTRSQTRHIHDANYQRLTSSFSSSSTSSVSSSFSFDVPYHTLIAIENDTGASSLPEGAICAWLGLLSSIPSGWRHCNGENSTPNLSDKYIKAADATSELGATGGSLTHTHTVQSHTHSNTGHTHLITFGQSRGGSGNQSFLSNLGSLSVNWHRDSTHNHASSTSTSTSATSGSNTHTVQDTNHEPEYRTVAWIQFQDILTIEINSPTDNQEIGDASPTITWSDPDGNTQISYRVRIYSDLAEDVEVYDSGLQSSSTRSHTVPFGNLVNEETYYLRITSTVSTAIENLTGTSGQRVFTTSWTPPATITGLAVAPRGGN